MTLSRLIAALQAIQAAHGGDVVVLHHDDWNDFVVDQVSFVPGEVDPVGLELGEEAPFISTTHVLIEGCSRFEDGKGGFTEPPR